MKSMKSLLLYPAKLQRVCSLIVGGLLISTSSFANAQTYPSQSIRLLVPFAAAGTSDLVSRIVASELASLWNVAVVVENRAGAGGNVGSEIIAKTAPDGYSLLMGTVATHAINSSLYSSLPFDHIKDFDPVSLVASTPSVLEVNLALPVNSVQELINYAKNNPGKLNFGSAGNGSSHHLAGELFNTLAGTKMIHVPYRGTAAALTDVVGGQIQVVFDTLPSSMSFIKAKKLKVLAVTSAQRDPALPDVPTIAESGVPNYEVGSWYGLLVPAGTPKPIVDKLGQAIAQIVRMPDVRAKLLALGATPVGNSPPEFAAHIRKETDKWSAVIKSSEAKVD